MSKHKKQKAASKRHDTDAIKRRVDQVLEILIDGAKRHDVLQFAARKQALDEVPWTMGKSRKPLCERTIDTYIAQANERIAAISLQHAEHRLSLAILRRERLYAREIEDKNWQGAHAILRDLDTLTDLYPAPKKQRVEIAQLSGSFEDMTDDEIAVEIARLEGLCPATADPGSASSEA